MQLLTFTVAGDAYAIESRRVVEVLPLVPARPLPGTPPFVRGIFTYRGQLVPLVDLGLRLVGGALADRLSTRIVVVECPAPAGGGSAAVARLGLVAEDVTAICPAESADASLPPPALPDAPYLGRLLRLGGRTVQVLDVDRILPADLAAGLLRPAPANAEGPR